MTSFSINFYQQLQTAYDALLENIVGMGSREDKHAFAALTFYRFTLLGFLQSKQFLNQDSDYLARHWQHFQSEEGGLFYGDFFAPFIFQILSVPTDERQVDSQQQFGEIPYLPLNIFRKQSIETAWPEAGVRDEGFQSLFTLLEQFKWHLTDVSSSHRGELVPADFIQFIETYINQRKFNAFYTAPMAIASHICNRTICNTLISHFPEHTPPQEHLIPTQWILSGLITDADSKECKIIQTALHDLKILDPACGTGSFLHAALDKLLGFYQLAQLRQAQIGKPTSLVSTFSNQTLFFKQQIILHNLFGVDINPEGLLLTQLRLCLTLAASCQNIDDLRALTSTEENIRLGNSLIGLTAREKQPSIFPDIHSADQVLLEEFKHLRIRYEQATWDEKRNTEGKTEKRDLTIEDIEGLRPFHWTDEFPEIMQRGGFDIVLTNPPWDIVRLDEKAFFSQYYRNCCAIRAKMAQKCEK